MAADSGTQAPGSSPPTILVADGDPEHRDLLVRNLGRLGSVHAVGDGSAAVAAIGSATPPDVVLTDQRLLGVQGLDVLRRASARDPHVGRILLTSYGDTGLTIQAIDGGRVDAYLTKPCLPHQLRLTVAAVLDRVHLARQNERLMVNVQEKNRALELALTSLRGAQGRIIDGERLGAIARTCAMVAHDFRGPLTVIRSGAGHLLRGEVSPEEHREIAEQLLAESVRMGGCAKRWSPRRARAAVRCGPMRSTSMPSSA